MSRKRVKKKNNEEKPIEAVLNIIIPVYGRFDLLRDCLESIPQAAGNVPYRIYLFDNNSPDKNEADDFYRSIFSGKHISVIRNEQNVGFPKACNLASRRGRAPYIFFLNSDVILYPDAITYALEEFEDEKVGAVGMKLIFPPEIIDDPIRPAGKVQHVGLSTNIRGDFMHTFIGWSPDSPRVNAVREVYAVTGAAMITRRNLWIKAGGFNENYAIGTWEDIDYCLTIREMGYNIIVSTKSVAYHYTGATATKYQIPYPTEYNRLIFLQKWANKLTYSEWSVL